MVKNSPANAEDMGSMSGLGRFHILGGDSPYTTATEHTILAAEPMYPRSYAPTQEKSLQVKSPCTTVRE